ncbi:MAG TPA: protein-methionine-sulfoxide reductase heme-binding subunit MsrQ [Bryobacteraceae bacterium]|nr:protein-methionine-sulfoxide reductase heme-binding subunit MsrQ [Bryobacteraceae bacterium]HPT27540.1 protein-methionine-sulfoxide reductase heme-binding subunit MsrQ [Bryobacteraceae bacterium]
MRLLATRWAKAAAIALMLTPAALLAWNASHGDLGANPIEAITKGTGIWTLRMLLISLSVTPLRRLISLPELAPYRRIAGLATFFYAAAHLMTYVWLDQFFDWHAMLRDIGKRRFIAAGLVSVAAMAPLAVTSTKGWMRRLGGRRWKALHRLAYFSAVAGVVHYLWLVKSDVRGPAAYGAALAVLLLARAVPVKSVTGSVGDS